MFKHILLPTDGSALSERAIQRGIQLARTVDAKVTGLYAGPKFHVFTYRTEMLEDTRGEYVRDCRAHAEKYLAAIEKAAKEAGVACSTEYVTDDQPHQAIIDAARNGDCDLIVMASHGRSGLEGVLLGSVTQKVLTLSSIPVLVCR